MTLPRSAGLILALLSGGCDLLGASGSISVGAGGSPVVRATSSGSATLTIIGCPRTPESGQMWQEFIEMMVNSPNTIVSADKSAQSRLILNGCPFPDPPPISRGR